MPFAIRESTASDFDVLWRIDQNCFPPGIAYSKAELRYYMRGPDSFTLVAIKIPSNRDGATIESPSDARAGFIVAESDRRSGHIITIDVMAEARRAGVGSLLLQAAEERLRKDRCSAVELETAVDNISALAFYKRHGYSVVKTYPRYYPNGVDALGLQKNL